MMSQKGLLFRLMFFHQNLEYFLDNCLFLNFEWSIVLEIDRTKENARNMGSISVIPSWTHVNKI